MTPQQYLVKAAQARGVNPLDLATVMARETGGTFNPDIWGGAGGRYYGLIQFGDNERKQFGVNSLNPSFNDQVDASLNFLQSRGFKPNMNRMDMYSTVLAGSPGHYNSADQNGSVKQHVADMGKNEQQALKWLGDAYSANPAQPASGPVGEPVQLTGANMANGKADPIADYLERDQQERLAGASKYAMGLLGGAQGHLYDPTPMMQPMTFQPAAAAQAHIPSPQKFAGLLGR